MQICFKKIEKLFCYLYEMPNETNINETRYNKLCMVKRSEPKQLLPTNAVLTQHIICVN